MIDAAADAAIGAYQRYVSPYKGFRCAYRVHTGRRSCSAYARTVVTRLGAAALPEALPRQLARCQAAFAALSAAEPSRRQRKPPEQRRRWWDHCDCGGCDLPCNLLGKAKHCDLPCDCGPCDCSP